MNAEDRYDSLFQFYGEKFRVPWLYLKAQVKAESNFNPRAKSPVGAMGLAQFMPKTFAEIAPRACGYAVPLPAGVVLDPFNPETSICSQAYYMHELLKTYELERALACYNWGMGHVQKLGGKSWEEIAEKTPQETQKYVQRIMTFLECYRTKQALS